MKNTLTVAIIQAAPVYYDLKKSLARASTLIKEAAASKARVIVLGETWLPGYPAWLDHSPGAALWNNQATKELHAVLRANSVTVPGAETAALASLARKLRIVLVIGVNERVSGGKGSRTLYNSLLTFDADGSLVNHHRKLVPTFTERLVWGHGDGAGLKVAETRYGRVGGLICWEHWMPLARQVLHNNAETIHVAAWPGVHEMHQVASRHYAFEGRCFVLAAGLIMPATDMPRHAATPSHLTAKNPLLIRGGSAIIAPDGSYVAGPVFDKEEIIHATLDLSMIDKESMTLDTSGHYSRNDIFSFTVNDTR